MGPIIYAVRHKVPCSEAPAWEHVALEAPASLIRNCGGRSLRAVRSRAGALERGSEGNSPTGQKQKTRGRLPRVWCDFEPV